MKKILFAAFAAAALAIGCSQDEVLNESPSLNQAIEFSTYTGKAAQTKGLETTTATIKVATTGFGINAAYTGQKNFATGNEPNFMYNEQVTYNTGTKGWEYSPVKYWPTMIGDKISFFAWAPYGAAGIDLAGHSAADKLTFTVQAQANNMVDFVAGNAIDKTQKDAATGGADSVKFNLLHELSRLDFKVKTSEDLENGSYVVLKSATLSSLDVFYQSATYIFSDKEGQRGAWIDRKPMSAAYDIKDAIAWENVSISSYVNPQAIQINSNTTPKSLFTSGQYLFLIPANGGTNAATVTFEYDIVTEDKNLALGYSITKAKKTVKLPANILQQGVAYSIVFTFNMDQIEVSATVDTWNTTTDQEIDVPFTPDVE